MYQHYADSTNHVSMCHSVNMTLDCQMSAMYQHYADSANHVIMCHSVNMTLDCHMSALYQHYADSANHATMCHSVNMTKNCLVLTDTRLTALLHHQVSQSHHDNVDSLFPSKLPL